MRKLPIYINTKKVVTPNVIQIMITVIITFSRKGTRLSLRNIDE